jgi:hypothetical protein
MWNRICTRYGFKLSPFDNFCWNRGRQLNIDGVNLLMENTLALHNIIPIHK